MRIPTGEFARSVIVSISVCGTGGSGANPGVQPMEQWPNWERRQTEDLVDVKIIVSSSLTCSINKMAGITIIDVKIVGLCSKHRQEGDDIPKNKYGVPYPDKDICCIVCDLN